MIPTLSPEIVAPTELPLSIAALRAQSVIDYADDDLLIDSYQRAAVAHLDGHEGILGRAVMSQEVVQRFGSLCTTMRLPYGSVSSVNAITYFDTDNVVQSLTNWTLLRDAAGDFISFSDSLPATYARPDAVHVSYTAGWADAAAVPHAIKQAIQLMVAHWYNQREAAVMTTGQGLVDIPLGVWDLVAPLRRVGV